MRENEGGVDMALIKCPECGKEISDAAESCPNCGYPIKGQQQIGDSDGLGKGQETKKLKTVLFIVVGIILVVIVCGGSLLFKKGGLIDKLTDKEAPKFENVPTELTFNVDDDVKFNDIVKEKNIKVTDNVDTDIEIKIDSSQVKLDVPGKYLITLSARDKAKNIGKVEVPVYVNDYETHKEYLAAITLEKSKLDKSSSGSYQYEGITVPDSEVRERKMIYHKAEGRCQLCGCKITYDEMSLDHIVPLAMGGEDSLENLQATCEPCNSHKKALLPEAYFDKVNRTFVFQMNKKYSHNLLWKLSKLFIGRLEKQA